MNRIALATIVSLLTTACAPHQRTGGTLLAVGGTALVAGFAIASQPDQESRSEGLKADGHDGGNWTFRNQAIGAGIVLLGTALLVGGGMSLARSAPDDDLAPLAVVDDSERPATMPLAALPVASWPLDPRTVALARMTRNAVLHGECDAAALILVDLRAADPTYARRVVDSPVFARCR